MFSLFLGRRIISFVIAITAKAGRSNPMTLEIASSFSLLAMTGISNLQTG